MIRYSSPALSSTLAEYMELSDLWESCSPCVGFCVSLGDKFFSTGVQEVDAVIQPHLSSMVGRAVVPRVLPAYSILYWFTLQVCSLKLNCLAMVYFHNCL